VSIQLDELNCFGIKLLVDVHSVLEVSSVCVLGA
jgi:hypothetical protein